MAVLSFELSEKQVARIVLALAVFAGTHPEIPETDDEMDTDNPYCLISMFQSADPACHNCFTL